MASSQPIHFAQRLFPKQEAIARSPARFKVVAFGRQAGKSYLAKRIALEKAANEGKRVLITFPSINSGRTHWREMVRQLRGYKYVQIKQASKEMIFSNGGSIDLRTVAEPENLRGGTYDYIICDESAFYSNGEELFVSIIQPMVTASGGGILLISSPCGKNWFYDQFMMKHDPIVGHLYESWQMKSEDSPFQDKATLSSIKQNMLKRGLKNQWLQEYEAQFIDGVTGLFSGYGDVAIGVELESPKPFSVYVGAIDWGMGGDDTGITIFDKYERKQVKTVRFKSDDPDVAVATLVETIKFWGVAEVNVERNGMGEVYFALLVKLVEKEGRDMTIRPLLHPYYQTNDTKRTAVEKMSIYISSKQIQFLDDPVQTMQFNNFVRTVKPDGRVVYGARKNYNDDLVLMCLMAIELLEPVSGVDYEEAGAVTEDNYIRSPFQ